MIGKSRPDAVMVFGDANTTLAGAIATIKMHVPVCHVEAGLRSYDISMPEEVNRVLTDHYSQMLCAPTLEALENLKKEGLKESIILLSGDTMYDAILEHEEDIEKSTIVKDLGLTEKIYATLTLHRPGNVDDTERLTRIISAILDLTEIKVVFPVHPRTKKRLKKANLLGILKLAPNVILTEPLSYFDMLNLMKCSAVVLTDSGGMQKEAFFLHVPCVTLRNRTEWLETIELGSNTLVGAEKEQILAETKKVLMNEGIRRRLESLPNPFGEGKASQKIVRDLKERFYSGRLTVKSPTV
ncbi:MAG: non-hydrolyzing UDP-N-acetylglucosamine 2-epimerase [Candidatus Bathyarchaeia archaeon]